MKDQYLSVTALTKYLKRKMELDPHLREVWLRAEISNFKLHSRGHMYLTLKDEESRINAIMFSSMNRNLSFMPEDGMNVLVKGKVSVYKKAGQYQLYINEMQPDGIGSLYLAYEQLKNKFEKLGYFSNEHKKRIPSFPENLAVITSKTGAVVKDILTTIERRYPFVEVTIFPVSVQGEKAKPSIIQAINQANDLAYFDTIILARGGGSIEDLWAFNEEEVIKAVFASKTPVISAIGHETDTTLTDLVADLRAATPTAAAEMAVPSQMELKKFFHNMKERLTINLKQMVQNKQEYLIGLKRSYAFRYPEQLLMQKEQEIDTFIEQLVLYLERITRKKEQDLNRLISEISPSKLEQGHRLKEIQFNNLFDKLQANMKLTEERKTNIFKELITKLTILNPLETMRRGFAIPYDEKDKIIYSVDEVKQNDLITVKLADGNLNCTVNEIREEQNDR